MDKVCGILLIIGSFFTLVSALGILRFPHLLLRMHAATKAGTMGLGLVLIAAMLYLTSLVVIIKAITIVFFTAMTMPIAAHMIGRIAYVTTLGNHYGKITIDSQHVDGTITRPPRSKA